MEAFTLRLFAALAERERKIISERCGRSGAMALPDVLMALAGCEGQGQPR